MKSIQYEIGELMDFADEEVKIPDNLKSRLHGLGYRKYSKYNDSIDSLACAPIKKLFLSDPDVVEKIDAIIIAKQKKSFNIISYLRSAGVKDVPVIELGGMDCASLAASICYANLLVSNSIYNNILCCFATIVDDTTELVLEDGAALCSDGSACCIVSSENGIVELRDFEQSTNFEVYDNGPTMNRPHIYFSFFRTVFEQVMRRRSHKPFDHMVPVNFPLVSNLFPKLVGSTCGQPFLDNIGRFAHAGSSDVLINLRDLYDRGERGELLIVGIGPHSVCMISAVAS